MENKSIKTSGKGIAMLFLTAIIWGISFVSQSVGMESVQPFTFMGIRTLMGSFVLLPFILIRDKLEKPGLSEEELKSKKKQTVNSIKYGAFIGLFLCAATNFQQFAFYFSTAGKIAFVTAMYMFFVPLLGLFLFKKKIPLITWLCILLGFAGLYLLCFKGQGISALNNGDLLALICAVFFTFQILLIEKLSVKCDGVKLSCAQFFVAGIISLILMFIFEKPQIPSILEAKWALLYSGVMSCGIAYTMQVEGQQKCEATIASLIMCMESVFAVLSAAIILNERLSVPEIIGCSVMFTAIVLSQLAERKKA